jgi:hypothetical protein
VLLFGGSSLLKNPYIPYVYRDLSLEHMLRFILNGKMDHLTKATRSPLSFWGDGGFVQIEYVARRWNQMVAHETQGFILVWGTACAKP